MSKYEKAKDRILQRPKDYTYTEAKYLLGKLGFEERNKGKHLDREFVFYVKEIKLLFYCINHILMMSWIEEQ